MALFEVPVRASKTDDNKIAKRSKTSNKSVTTVKGGLIGRINQIKAKVEQSLGKYKDEYMIINDKDVLIDYIDHAIQDRYIAIDTETTGLDPLQDTLVGICPNVRSVKPAYIPLNHISYITNTKADGQLPVEFVIEQFKRLIDVDIDMFNACFDIRVLRHAGWKNAYCTWDGYLGSQLLNENDVTHGLKALHQKYVLDGKEDEFSFGELFKGITFDKIPINVGYLYAAHDGIVTTEYCDYQRRFLREDNEREDMRQIYWVFKNIEMPCIKVVADMEDTGITFDMEYQNKLSTKYNELLKEKEQNCYDNIDKYKDKIEKYKKRHKDCKLDTPVNIGSPTQLAILLYDILEVGIIDERHPRGTGEEILVKIDNPICKAILEYREVSKLVTTYIDKMPACVNPNDGRIHCKFNQYGAKTGRFSSSDPNLQNIPSHNKDIRKMFKATDGYVLMSSDYSQQEPKVMTQMCGDEKMLNAYRHNKDLYAQIASIAFNKPYEECLEFYLDENGNKTDKVNKEGKERRSSAKSILLGILYGRGINSVAEQLNTTKQKAQQIQDKIFKGFPAIPQFEQDSKDMALELGYVTTLWGRKRRLPDLSLNEYEFSWKDGAPPDEDLLDFNNTDELYYTELDVPEDRKRYYLSKLSHCWGKEKRTIFAEADKEGIKILDNGAKIADADRQVVNARIQGSAADMSKLAMILVGNDEQLKKLGFRLLIPVHDELIAECPEENAKEAAERFALLMSKAAESKLTVPISCDVEVTKQWYGERIEL